MHDRVIDMGIELGIIEQKDGTHKVAISASREKMTEYMQMLLEEIVDLNIQLKHLKRLKENGK